MTVFKITEHKLTGPDVTFSTSPNTGGAFAAGSADTIVMHFTAGSSLESSVRTLCDADNSVSAHLVVGRDGKVVQLVPFDTVAWHAGKSTWQGRSGLNKFSIGIELDNAGQLKPNGQGQFLSWFNRAYKDEDVFCGVHRNQQHESYWHAYTEAQIDTTFELCKALCAEYGIQNIVGHEEIAPKRKVDPGPAFPLDKLRALLTNERAEDGQDDSVFEATSKLVNASRLNVREGPGAQFDKVTEPLPLGTEVKVVQQKGGWSEVEFRGKGWVSSKYLT